MSEETGERIRMFTAGRGLTLGVGLGSGIHGTVYSAKDNARAGRFALKFHEDRRAYCRERDAYLRLAQSGNTQVVGFAVPQMLYPDNEWMVIAMTIVSPPFALDFGAAYLDFAPEFSDEILAARIDDLREKFGSNWDTLQIVLSAFEALGIYQTDPSPSNIRFR